MELRDIGVLVSIAITLLSLAYTLGQLKGSYVTREMHRDLEARLAKQTHDSALLHQTLATKSEVVGVQERIDARFEALGHELQRITSSMTRIQRAVEKISDKVWPRDTPPKIDGGET